MIKKINIIIIIFLAFFLYSCQGAKEAFKSKKRSDQSDEFLVQKKNPLTMPPDFEKLPTPKSLEEGQSNKDSETSDIKSLLKLEENTNIQNDESSNLQESILKKIE